MPNDGTADTAIQDIHRVQDIPTASPNIFAFDIDEIAKDPPIQKGAFKNFLKKFSNISKATGPNYCQIPFGWHEK